MEMSESGKPVVPAATSTVGAVVGGLIAATVTAKTQDPTYQVLAQSVIPAFFAALFHWAHAKIGTPE